MKKKVHQSQLNQNELLQAKESLLIEGLNKDNLSHNILNTIVGGLDDNLLSDPTKQLDGTDLIDANDADDTSPDVSEDGSSEALEADSFSTESINSDSTQEIDSESIEADSAEFDEPLEFGDGDSAVTITQDTTSGGWLIQRGLDEAHVPSDAVVSSDESTGSRSYTSDAQTLTITANGEIDITFNATGQTLTSVPGNLHVSFLRDHTADTHFTSFEDGSVIISSVGSTNVVDPEGNLSSTTFGDLNLESLSDRSSALDKTLALIPNSISAEQPTAVIDGRFTPEVINPGRIDDEILMFVTPADDAGQHEVIRVDKNGEIQHAWGVTDVEAWNNALVSGDSTDDLAKTQLTRTQDGQLTLNRGVDGLDLTAFTSETAEDGTVTFSDGLTTYKINTDGDFEVIQEGLDTPLVFGEGDSTVSVTRTATPDQTSFVWTVQRDSDVLHIPSDAIPTIDMSDGSMTFTSDIQTITIDADGRIDIIFDETGKTLSILPEQQGISFVSPEESWTITTTDTQVASFDDGSVLIRNFKRVILQFDDDNRIFKNSSHLLLFDPQGNIATGTYGDTLLDSTSDQFSLEKTFSLVPNNGEDIEHAVQIDSNFTLKVENTGLENESLTFESQAQHRVIRVDQTGTIRDYYVSDIDAWNTADNSGDAFGDIVKTLVTTTSSGQISVTSEDLNASIETGDAFISNEDNDVTAIEVVNDDGDFQILLHPDGSVESQNILRNRDFGDLTLNYGRFGRATISWDGKEVTLPLTYSSEDGGDDSIIFSNGPSTIQLTPPGVIDVSNQEQHFHLDPIGDSYWETVDQDGNSIRTSLNAIMLNPNESFTFTPEGSLNVEIADANGDDKFTIDFSARPDALVVERGKDIFYVPADATSTYNNTDKTTTFTSDFQTFRIGNDGQFTLTYNATGLSFMTREFEGIGEALRWETGDADRDGQTFDAQITSYDDGSVLLTARNGAAILADSEGHSSDLFIGDDNHFTTLVNVSDNPVSTSASDRMLALVPENGQGMDHSVVIDGSFATQVNNGLLTFVGDEIRQGNKVQREVIHVNQSGDIEQAWVTDFEAWKNAIDSGAVDDDLVLTKLTVTVSGQASIQSKDLRAPVQLGNFSLVDQGDGTKSLDISNEDGDFQMLLHADGSVQTQQVFSNRVFGDSNSDNVVTLSYGLGGQMTLSGKEIQLNFPVTFTAKNIGKSIVLSNGFISYQVNAAGEIDATFDKEQHIHLDPNGNSYKETVDQARISLEPIMRDPNARYILTPGGSLGIEITDANVDDKVSIDLNANPNAFVVERDWNSLLVPNDALISYNETDDSITFASDAQTLNVSAEGIIRLQFNLNTTTGLTLVSIPGENLQLVGFNDQKTFPPDARFTSFEDSSVQITSSSFGNLTTVIDPQGNISDTTYGGTQLITLSENGLSTSDKTLGLVINDDLTVVIDSSFTPIVDKIASLTSPNGSLTFVGPPDESGQQEVIYVNQTGDVEEAWVTDLKAWKSAIDSGEPVDDLIRTQITFTLSGHVSIQSQDLTMPLQSGDFTYDNDTKTLDISNEDGDFQMLIHDDGSVETQHAFSNREFGDSDSNISLNFGLDGQASVSWGEGNRFDLFNISDMEIINEDDDSVSLSNGAMSIQVGTTIDVNLDAGVRVHIDPNGESYKEIVNQDGNVERTVFSSDASYIISPEGEFVIESTGPNGEELETRLQSVMNENGQIISTFYDTISAHDVTLTTGQMVLTDPEKGQGMIPTGDITFTNTPAEFSLDGDSWSDKHGLTIPKEAVPHITDNGHIQFTYQDSDENRVIYDFNENGDLISIEWPDSPEHAELTKLGTNHYQYTITDGTTILESKDLMLPSVNSAGSFDLLRAAPQLISSEDGRVFFETFKDDGTKQKVTIDATGQLTNIDEIPVTDYLGSDLPTWAEIELYKGNILDPFAQAMLTYGNTDNLPYWALQILLGSDSNAEFVDYYEQKEIFLLAQQGVDALQDPSSLPFHYADKFLSLTSDEKDTLLSLAQQIDAQNEQQSTVRDALAAHAQQMLESHENLLKNITLQQIDQLSQSIINDTNMPDWANEVLPQLNTIELDQLLSVMHSRLSTQTGGDAEDVTFGDQKLNEAFDTLKQDQTDKFNRIAQTILDEAAQSQLDIRTQSNQIDDDVSQPLKPLSDLQKELISMIEPDDDDDLFNIYDWIEQELSNPESEFGSLDAIQQIQFQQAMDDLQQVQGDEALDRAREIISGLDRDREIIFDDELLGSADKIIFNGEFGSSDEDLTTYQKNLLQQYLTEDLKNGDFISNAFSENGTDTSAFNLEILFQNMGLNEQAIHPGDIQQHPTWDSIALDLFDITPPKGDFTSPGSFAALGHFLEDAGKSIGEFVEHFVTETLPKAFEGAWEEIKSGRIFKDILGGIEGLGLAIAYAIPSIYSESARQKFSENFRKFDDTFFFGSIEGVGTLAYDIIGGIGLIITGQVEEGKQLLSKAINEDLGIAAEDVLLFATFFYLGEIASEGFKVGAREIAKISDAITDAAKSSEDLALEDPEPVDFDPDPDSESVGSDLDSEPVDSDLDSELGDNDFTKFEPAPPQGEPVKIELEALRELDDNSTVRKLSLYIDQEAFDNLPSEIQTELRELYDVPGKTIEETREFYSRQYAEFIDIDDAINEYNRLIKANRQIAALERLDAQSQVRLMGVDDIFDDWEPEAIRAVNNLVVKNSGFTFGEFIQEVKESFDVESLNNAENEFKNAFESIANGDGKSTEVGDKVVSPDELVPISTDVLSRITRDLENNIFNAEQLKELVSNLDEDNTAILGENRAQVNASELPNDIKTSINNKIDSEFKSEDDLERYISDHDLKNGDAEKILGDLLNEVLDKTPPIDSIRELLINNEITEARLIKVLRSPILDEVTSANRELDLLSVLGSTDLSKLPISVTETIKRELDHLIVPNVNEEFEHFTERLRTTIEILKLSNNIEINLDPLRANQYLKKVLDELLIDRDSEAASGATEPDNETGSGSETGSDSEIVPGSETDSVDDETQFEINIIELVAKLLIIRVPQFGVIASASSSLEQNGNETNDINSLFSMDTSFNELAEFAPDDLLDELRGLQITSAEQAFDAANQLLKDDSMADFLGHPDPDTLAQHLLNGVRMGNAFNHQIMVFNALSGEKKTEIMDTIGSKLRSIADSDTEVLSTKDWITIAAISAASGKTPEELAESAAEVSLPSSTEFSNVMLIMQAANSSEFINQLQAYNEASDDDKSEMERQAEDLLSQSNVTEIDDLNALAQAEAVVVGQSLADQNIDALSVESEVSSDSISLIDSIQARIDTDAAFAAQVRAMEIVDNIIMTEDPGLAQEMKDAISFMLAQNNDESVNSDVELAVIAAGVEVLGANAEEGATVTADNFANSASSSAEHDLTPAKAFEITVNVNIDGGNQSARDNINTLVNEFRDSINNQATSAQLNNQSLSATTVWAPNLEGKQLGALAAKYIVDNDLDADSVLATLDVLNDDEVQKQDTRIMMNDIDVNIQQKLATDDAFAMDVARRESLFLAIAASSPQLNNQIIGAVSYQLSTLHSVDDFNALSDQEQATIAAAMSALGVTEDVNAQTQSPDDFETVELMGNALTEQPVIDAETEYLNSDTTTMDTDTQSAANNFNSLSAVRAFIDPDTKAFNTDALLDLGYLLAEASLEGLDPESLYEQENSTFTEVI